MDARPTEKTIKIGSILAAAESEQISLIESYLEEWHSRAWELALIIGGQGKRSEKEKAESPEAYKAWLLKHDRAWQNANAILAQPPTTDWEALSEAVGLSPETCRQIAQALGRGASEKKEQSWL